MSGPVPSPSMNGTIGRSGTRSPCGVMAILSPSGTETCWYLMVVSTSGRDAGQTSEGLGSERGSMGLFYRKRTKRESGKIKLVFAVPDDIERISIPVVRRPDSLARDSDSFCALGMTLGWRGSVRP
jgi:hypothetical protein